MFYKRVLTIQDISCIGQCSMTVALPILSACQVETCILPSAVLSSHTGGFQKPHVRDLSGDMPLIAQKWKQEGIFFDAVYTGYLGSIQQIDFVKSLIGEMLSQDGLAIVDPAMADHGKLYSGFDGEYALKMRELCQKADVVIPNITEACMMTDTPFLSSYTKEDMEKLVLRLHESGMQCVVLTGVGFESDTTGVLVSRAGEIRHYAHRKIAKSYHGTGDMFAAAFTGALMQEKDLFQAAQIAADFTTCAIENTFREPVHWYGVKFETAIPSLINALK